MDMFDLLKASVWDSDAPIEYDCDYYIFDELRTQAIVALPAPILQFISMPQDLRDQWDKAILQYVSYYAKYKYAQNRLPITVPYVILKGTSASQYYPHPEYRTMGDIDIMTRREDLLTGKW